jgi:riboflavin kinase / FMN adenylyltransferase
VELTSVHIARPVVLSIGVFDGVHLGHQHLLASVVSRARELGAVSAALTFDPRPQAVLFPASGVSYLTDLRERACLIARIGIERCCYLHFDTSLARMTAEEFVDLVLRHLSVVELRVGPDFALGSDRGGTVAKLAEMGLRKGFAVVAVRKLELGGAVVSSTTIRSHLKDGRVEDAARMLGRPYELYGPVIEGDRRGRQLGFPTANVGFDASRAIPADGVYAAFATTDPPGDVMLDCAPRPDSGTTWQAVVSIGVRPTFGGGKRGIEAHLLDFHGDLYGRTIRLRFVSRLRPELTFSSADALIAQMNRDVVDARAILANQPDSASGQPTTSPA